MPSDSGRGGRRDQRWYPNHRPEAPTAVVVGVSTPQIDHAGALAKQRWANDNQGLDKLVDRLARRAGALTDEQAAQIEAVLAARAEARRAP